MNLISRSSYQVANVAIIWFVLVVTKSALDVAIVGIADTVATVLATLPAGVWVDRYNRRMLLFSSNTLRAVCLLLLTVLTAAYGLQIIAVIAIVFVWSMATELYRSTDYSILPELVKVNEVPDANGVTRAGYQLVGSASSAIGGALVALVGVVFAFAYGTAGYAIAATFSAFLFYQFRRSTTHQRSDSNETKKQRMMGREIKEGFSWLVKQRGLFQLSLSAVAFNFLFGMPSYFLVVYVKDALNANALIFGIVLASFVIGDALGSVLVGRTNAIAHAGKVWIIAYGGVAGLLLLLLGFFPSTIFAVVATFATGFGVGFGGNVWLTSAQNLVPPNMRGRYFAIDGLLSFIGGPPAIAIGGILITILGILPVYELSGALLLVFVLVFALMRSLWILDGRSAQASTQT